MSLDFEFTLEQKLIEESVWRWASDGLEPQMEELYEKDEMPPELFRELGKLGVNGIVFEEEYGGTGLGYVETLLIYETIGRVSNALAMTVGEARRSVSTTSGGTLRRSRRGRSSHGPAAES
jgi:alkylation response protein AidB-like acyl-CoA dehydrogenase